MSVQFIETHPESYNDRLFKEYNKTIEELNEYVEILRNWVETQPHFPEKPADTILRFMILYNKFSIEKAKQKLDMYYTIRNLIPDVYNKHPLWDDVKFMSKVLYVVPLPKCSSDFKRVIYSQMNPNYGPEDFTHELYPCHVAHVVELLMQEDDCFSCHFIFDFKGFKLGHIPKFNPMVVRKGSVIMEKVYSNRVASIILVNFHPFMENFLNTLIKPMLSAKLRDRIKIFSTTEPLLEMFGKNIMPKDIGGDEKSLEELNDVLYKKFEEYKPRFDFLQTLQIDESLRPTKLVNDDILGYYGNFKKINVD